MLYILALGSPTHPIAPTAWNAYTSTYTGASTTARSTSFAPLFGHQYSHVWIDFRGIQDPYMRERGLDYFENSRRATLSQRPYAIANPRRLGGYGAKSGASPPCDGPAEKVYRRGRNVEFRLLRRVARHCDDVRDDGTLAPTAAGGSIAFRAGHRDSGARAMRSDTASISSASTAFSIAFNPS